MAIARIFAGGRRLRAAAAMVGLLVLFGCLAVGAFDAAARVNESNDEPASSKNAAGAELSDHPVVAGFDRFLADDSAQRIEGGMLLLGELNCTSCHAASDKRPIDGKQAPRLEEVGSRVSVDFLRRYLVNPADEKPGTTMPHVFAGVSPERRDAEIEALVHYFTATAAGRFRSSPPSSESVVRGETLFHDVGCVACHGPHRELENEIDEDEPLARSPLVPLGHVERKYSVASLSRFLADPLAIRPSGRMPHFVLIASEAENLAAYLMRDVDLPAPIRVAYYEGRWKKLPDFDSLKPKFEGGAFSFSPRPRLRDENYGLRFDSFLHVETEGDYEFRLTSDDGSRLSIDGKMIVDNDGEHAAEMRQGKARLGVGAHPLRVEFMEIGNVEMLLVEMEGPGVERGPIPVALLSSQETPPAEKAELVVDAKLVDEGRKVFSRSCAACHKPEENRPGAKSLDLLDPSKGCLSGEATEARPFYQLSPAQHSALEGAIRSIQSAKKPAKPNAQRRIDATMTRLNCYACHQRDGKGGATRDREEFFTANGTDLGDEGRVPPMLNGVGDKLSTGWLRQILEGEKRSRWYMNTRMPQFGKKEVHHLIDDFAQADLKTERAPKPVDSTNELKEAGRLLVGKNGLSCISCHSFNHQRSLGIQVIDLVEMTSRLREDWFRRYMFDPQVYRPGTRMPQGWPGGQSTKRDVLDGDPERQLQAIWAYLSGGKKALAPDGVWQKSMELAATSEAIVYRNFLEGAGQRGIGVGYPESVNLSYDADDMRIAMIWRGRFIDASMHWTGRGVGVQSPLGIDAVRLVEGAPLAVLADEKTPWPTAKGKEAGYRFRGYRLDSVRRPEFLYDFGPVKASDYPIDEAADGESSLRRTLSLKTEKPLKNLWFRAAAGKIKSLGDGAFRVGENLIVGLDSSGSKKPLLRQTKEGTELLVAVEWADGAWKLTQTFHWSTHDKKAVDKE